MDWQNQGSAGRVVIALARLPAKSLTDYKGSMFFNPGVCFASPHALVQSID
jgi:hypothetical protein